MSLAEWSDRYRVLTSEGSAEPGKWRTARTPYLREIMDALSPSSPITDIWFMKGAQIGATEMAVNLVGYIIAHCPGPVLFVEPTSPMARRVVKQRIDPMIDSVAEVRDKLPDRFAKAGGNSVAEKLFPGGALIFSGANSASALCSIPIRVAILDEIDRYPQDVDGEGDPVQLAKARTRTFPNAKRLYISTPTIAGLSRIEAGYKLTDQRRFFVPCPHCGEFQLIEWSRMHWDKEPGSRVWLACEHNGCVIEETAKPTMLRDGEWRATKPELADPTIAGFHLSSWNSPLGWYSWTNGRDEYEASEGKPHARKTWTNTVEGRVHQESGEAPDWEKLYARRNNNPIGRIPEYGRLLTAGVDVQRDRLEVQITTWGENLLSQPIENLVFAGDTLDIDGPHSPWNNLDDLLAREWPHELGGSMAIRLMGVDSGYNTQAVYRWGRKRDRRRIALMKGRDTLEAAVSSPTHQDVKENGKRIRRGVMIWPVGVSLLKSELYSSLRRDPPPEGEPFPTRWVEFPQFGEEYFKQLTAEELATRINKRGYVVQEWRKTRDRNEALDTAIYARAASIIAGLDRMTDGHFEEIRKSLVPPDIEAEKKRAEQRKKRRPPAKKSIWKSRNEL